MFKIEDIYNLLEKTPIIAATNSDGWNSAIKSNVKVLFHLNANILNIKDEIDLAKKSNKLVFIHIDLADGIGKDITGIKWLAFCGIDGIISTRSHLIRNAKEMGLKTVQRFFVLDSKGMHSISDMIETTKPDMIEIMPGVIPKALNLFSKQTIPFIAGGLIETKAEVMEALSNGAYAVSTGKKELWNL